MGRLGDFEKMRVLYVAMGEKTLLSGQKWFEVNFHTFWGVLRSIKVVSVVRFGDQKCRFLRYSNSRAFTLTERRGTAIYSCLGSFPNYS